jgi:hypothetical protein
MYCAAIAGEAGTPVDASGAAASAGSASRTCLGIRNLSASSHPNAATTAAATIVDTRQLRRSRPLASAALTAVAGVTGESLAG